MTIFSETVEIKAHPEAVFQLISKVEEFSRYSKLISSVVKTGEKSYHWKTSLGGITLEWDAVVTEEYRPWRFAWHSIRGFQNSGAYTLTPSSEGTMVCFEMEYSLKVSILEKALSRVSDKYIDRLGKDILGEIKTRLEWGKD